MDKLGFVLGLAVVASAVAWALARAHRDARAAAAQPSGGRFALAVAAVIGAAIFLRLLQSPSSPRSARLAFALSSAAFGVASSMLVGLVRARLVARADAPPDATVRVGGASAIVAIVGAALGLATVVAVAVRARVEVQIGGGACAFALGGAIAALLGEGGGEAFVVAAMGGAATVTTAASVALRNDALLRAEGVDPAAVMVLPLSILLFGAIAAAIGVMAVRTDDDEESHASRVRGFAVATVVAVMSGATATQWYGGGHATWLMLPSVAGGIAAWLAMLLARYYDDPAQRPLRKLAREPDARARRFTSVLLGVEGGLALCGVAALAVVASEHAGDRIGLEGGGLLGVTVVASAILASSAYLAAVASAREDEGGSQTIAHDVVVLAIASFLLARAASGGHVEGVEALIAATIGLFVVIGFSALRLLGVTRAASVVLVVPIAWAALRASQGAASSGLSLATWAAAGSGLVLATVLERASITSERPRAMQLRAIAGSLPSLVAAAAACTATASAVLGT